MPHEGEGEEAALLGELVDVEYLGPLDPQESSHLQPIVARAQVSDALLIQARESCKVLEPRRGSALKLRSNCTPFYIRLWMRMRAKNSGVAGTAENLLWQ